MRRSRIALRVIALLALLLSTRSLLAFPVSSDRAQSVGVSALNILRSRAGLGPIAPEAATVAPLLDNGSRTVWLYVVTIKGEEGFALISGDDVGMPLLAYTLHGTIETRGRMMPANLRKWFESYREQIRRAALRNPAPDASTRSAWLRLEKGNAAELTSSLASAGPLVTTKWDQSPYYNDQCPYDPSANDRSVTGCVATAMAQVMKFWNYPEQGQGFYSYAHDVYGTLSANFGGTRYEWNQMPAQVSSDNPAVATLMYHCGVSVDMGYSPQESGAWVIDDGTGRACTETALRRFFRYDPSLRGVSRSDYNYSTWTGMLRDELDAGRPIVYDGFGGGGGHCFVCDGYQNTDYFHMNWGWSGAYDGFFRLDALNPDGVGTGGGDGGYNSGQEAVIGIKPSQEAGGGTPQLKINADLTLNTGSSIVYGDSISISSDILNSGAGDFNGDYCAAAFDAQGTFVAYLGIKEGWHLQGNNYHYTNGITFDTTGLFNLIPGTYTVAIFSRPTGGEWSYIPSTSQFTNSAQFTVTNDYDLQLDEEITVSNATSIYQGAAFEATANVYNGLSSTFTGSLELNLYSLDGEYAATIGTYSNVTLNPGEHFTNPLLFNTPSLGVQPGTYLAAVIFTEEGSSDSYLVGNGSYINPIKVVVQAPEILADRYEPNDQQGSAAVLVDGGGGTIVTDAANMHTGSDDDWYSFTVPSGRRYSVEAHVDDSYTNGSLYTNDVIFSTIHGNDTSDVYDTEMPGPVIVDGGETIFFHVAPYFAGDRGTYQLYINATDISSVDLTPALFTKVKALPNPAVDEVTLQLPADLSAESITLVNALGVNVRTVEGGTRVSLAGLPAGRYTLLATTPRGRYRASFVKAN